MIEIRGTALKSILRRHQLDSEWAQDLAELRRGLTAENRRWWHESTPGCSLTAFVAVLP